MVYPPTYSSAPQLIADTSLNLAAQVPGVGRPGSGIPASTLRVRSDAYATGHRRSLLHRRTGKNGREFVSAGAGHSVTISDAGGEPPRYFDHRGVVGCMAVGVVHRLLPVDIHGKHQRGLSCAQGGLQPFAE